MQNRMKLLGGILLIVGTAIGGGMLALPIATSPIGFVNSSLMLFFCWLLMTASAFLMLEVNLWLPSNSNIISMVKATLGRGWQVIAWMTYLLLLYSLLAAYIAGGGDFFKTLLGLIHINMPSIATFFIFTSLFGFIVYQGIKPVDLVNRALMITKFGAFFALVFLVASHVSLPQLSGGQFNSVSMSLTVAITSFGFSSIIPSLRVYFQNDVEKLRIAILVGSLIPLVCYIMWDFVIMGVIPREGNHGLMAMLHSGRSTSEFVNELSVLLQRDAITSFARIFTSICLLTSFLGVSLCLSDFLADGLRWDRTAKNRLFVNLLTFVPPLLIVIFYPGAFIIALSYAGIFCVFLLALLPALMAWYGRYHKQIASGYQVFGGKILLILIIVLSIGILLNSVVSLFY